MARLPAAHRRHDAIGAGEAKRMQRGAGGFRRNIDAAEVQLQPGFGGRQQFRHQLEHLDVTHPHLAQMAQALPDAKWRSPARTPGSTAVSFRMR